MKNKIFKNKGGGSLGSLRYLLDKDRVADGTAKVLRGNPKHTESLIKAMRTKQKVMMGVLSFEETYLDETLKEQLMTEFEELTFPGMDKSQYNILWVQHTDKDGRIELNYLIVKIELTTAKSLQPHYHRADYPRVDAWERLQNLKYNFTDPLDPSKARTLAGVHPDHEFMRDYTKLDVVLHRLVEEKELKSRNDIIGYLIDSGIEVTRQGKDYMSVKLKGRKKAQKFKTGTTGIYSKAFTSLEALADIQKDLEKAIQSYTEGREDFKKTEIPRLEASIEKMKGYKKKELLKKYPLPELLEYQEEIIIKEEENIAYDRDREAVSVSTGEAERIRARIRARANAKRKRTEAVHRKFEDSRDTTFDGLEDAADEVFDRLRDKADGILDSHRSNAEQMEGNTRSLIERVQKIGNKIGRGFKRAIDKVKEEAYRLFSKGNPDLEDQVGLGYTPGDEGIKSIL